MPSSPPDLRVDARFVFRTPLLPLDELLAWSEESGGDGARDRLRQALERPEVREAVFLASPGLAASVDAWLAAPDSPRGQKVERALVRYFSRMTARPTPFGLFSGVSVGRIDERTELVLEGRAAYGRSTRLDNDYLFALASALRQDPALRKALRWKPSSSLYSLAGRLRYAEARLRGSLRTHHLVAVEPSPYLDVILERARDGASLDELARAVVDHDPEIELDEAADFMHELVDSQILVCDLEPAVTGREPIEGILALLEALAPEAPATACLARTAARLADVDGRGVGQDPAVYTEIAADLEALQAPAVAVDRARLFQVDLVKPAPGATLGAAVVDALARGVDLLRRITPAPDDSALARFRRAFAERYEDREVPLIEALDEESGVGFETSNDPGAIGAPLLDGIDFPPVAADERARWSKLERFLLRRLEDVWARGARELSLDDADVQALAVDRPAALPDALAVVAAVAGASPEATARGDFEVLLRSAAGPSGARLLGRFCHASEEVHALVREHVRAEEALRPDAVFAEIVHLNEGRLGNVLCRPVLRGHEIPFLGVSGAPAAQHIPAQDLLVSVRGDRIVLRSRRLDREVVPRLSTAHNYNLRGVGMYRFLCALQGQDGGSWAWSWGALSSARFLPRVRWGRVVLSRARWRLDDRDLAPVAEAVRAARRASAPADVSAARARVHDAVRALGAALGLPRRVVVADSDNELLVDLDDALSANSFAWLVHRRSRADLVELYPGPEALAARGPEGRFTHELVVTFTRAGAPRAEGNAHRGARARARSAQVQRRFVPGGPWLYAKLYCGPSAADEVLRRAIAPVRAHAFATGAAEGWFFLRYADPAPHLRVRFRGDPARLRGEVLPALRAAAAPLLADGSLWRIQLDTYEREIERYGGPAGMEPCEAIFGHDSDAALDIVSLLEGDRGADARWRLAVRGADMLLDDLGLDTGARLGLARGARDAFRRELGATTAMYRQIGERFRREREALFALLARDPDRDGASELAPGLAALSRRSERLGPVVAELRARAGELDPPLEIIAGSLVHMHVNRMLHAGQRAQELVIHDFLHRWYASRRARDPGTM